MLADGLGEALLERLPADSFLRRQRAAGLRSVCPSGTTAALTTLATGQWPGSHGLLGWWTVAGDLESTVAIPPLVDRRTREDLDGLGGGA